MIVADVAGVRVVQDRRVDEERHRHVDLLARLQDLLVEAEAGDLAEVDAGLVGVTLKVAWPVTA